MIFPQFSTMLTSDNYTISEDGFMEAVRKFGKWTVLEVIRWKHRNFCITQCECGQKSRVMEYRLIKGMSSSCKFCAPKKHGHYNSRTNRSWSSARNRCFNENNKDYVNYGGRGIIMCERWNKFENFLEDMGECPEGLTLDRINNNGNYEPGNCRWATHSEQNKNQRKRSKQLIRKGVS